MAAPKAPVIAVNLQRSRRPVALTLGAAAIVLLGFGLPAAALIASILIKDASAPSQILFDRAAWTSPYADSRSRMTDDLRRNHRLVWKTPEDIEALLGKSDKEGNRLEYSLGYRSNGLSSAGFLVFWLNADGLVDRISVVGNSD